MSINVTCHLCHYTFEHEVLCSVETVSCPSCGVRFELKQKYQIDSFQIDQIEQELLRLRAEIERSDPQRQINREKSVIGPLPMQTLKMNFDVTSKHETDDQSLQPGTDFGAVRCHSSFGRLETEPEHLTAAEEQQAPVVPDDNTNEYQTRHFVSEDEDDMVGRSSFADDWKCLIRNKTKLRIRFAAAGILLCGVLCAVIFASGFIRSGNRSQRALREMPVVADERISSQIMDRPSLPYAATEARDTSDTERLLPLTDVLVDASSVPPNLIVQVAVPNPVTSAFVPEVPAPLPPVDSDEDRDLEMFAMLDQQLQETQTQLSRITQQYELTRQNNEQLERMAKQNEAESLLWEAYSNTIKSPVRSMVLSLQAIERFKELELDIPNNARWVLNQSLASQNLGIPFSGFQGGVDAMALNKDGQWFLFSGNDGSVWLCDISKHDAMPDCFLLDTIRSGVAQLLITSNCQYGICVGRNGAIRIWNLPLEKPSEHPIDIADPRCHFTHVVVSEDGHWLAAYGKPGRYENNKEVNDVYLWDLQHLTRHGSLNVPIVLKGHQKPIRSLAISSNSKWLVSGSEDQTVRVYDLKAAYPAAEQIVLKDHELAVKCVAISPNGRWLATGGGDSILRIWDMQSRQSMAMPIQLHEHEGWITTLTFSRDGRWLATGSYDNTIRIWRMDEEKQPKVVHVLTGHSGLIKSVDFSRQGNMLVSIGSDREVRLWNLEQGNPSENVLTFQCGPIPVSSVAMSGDGKWLILAQQKPNAVNSSGLRLWPLVFDQAYHLAAGFAESRYPALYKRRQNSVSPMLEMQEERIARTGSLTQTGTQYPVVPDVPQVEPTHYAPQPGHFSFSGNPTPPPQTPPPDGRFLIPQPGINITLSPR